EVSLDLVLELPVDAPGGLVGRDGIELLPAGAGEGVEVHARIHRPVHEAWVEARCVGQRLERGLAAGGRLRPPGQRAEQQSRNEKASHACPEVKGRRTVAAPPPPPTAPMQRAASLNTRPGSKKHGPGSWTARTVSPRAAGWHARCSERPRAARSAGRPRAIPVPGSVRGGGRGRRQARGSG